MLPQIIDAEVGTADSAPEGAAKINANARAAFNGAPSTLAKLKELLRSGARVKPFERVLTTIATAVSSTGTTTVVPSGISGFPATEAFILSANISKAFTGSVAGASSGTLSAAITAGTYSVVFAVTGEVRMVTVADAGGGTGTECTWLGALGSQAAINNASFREFMLVTAGFGTASWTVTRGRSGTSALASIPLGSELQWHRVALQVGATQQGGPSEVLGGSPVITPPGSGANTVAALVAQRMNTVLPAYITQAAMLDRFGAVTTGNLASSGQATLAVTSTAQFPQTGNFRVNVGGEDMTVNVAGPTSLNIVTRQLNGTGPANFNISGDSVFAPVQQVSFESGGGSAAGLQRVPLNSGLTYCAVVARCSPIFEWHPLMPVCISMIVDAKAFAILNVQDFGGLLIVDGEVYHEAAEFSRPISGAYWVGLDFGTRKPRRVQFIGYCNIAAFASLPNETILPWDRSAEPTYSADSDSYGGSESYTAFNVPAKGGLGPAFETAIALGIPQIDVMAQMGGAGYLTEPGNSAPSFPRPKYNALSRLPWTAARRAPWVFDGGNGLNDGVPGALANGSTATVANGTNTTLTVSSNTGYPSTATYGPFIINIESEWMLVTNNATTSWTVQRGYGGTTAAAHTSATVTAPTAAMFEAASTYWSSLRTAWPETVFLASHYWPKGVEQGGGYYIRACMTSALLYGLTQAGGPWVFADMVLGRWTNSAGSTGLVAGSSSVARSVITGTGYAAAPGYAGGHTVGDGNADQYIWDGTHPSNIGSRYLGTVRAEAFKAGVLAL